MFDEASLPQALLHVHPSTLVHDQCQQTRQAAFFDLAPTFGLSATRLLTVDVGKQFEEEEAEPDGDEEGAELDPQEDITRLVQLWELTSAAPEN